MSPPLTASVEPVAGGAAVRMTWSATASRVMLQRIIDSADRGLRRDARGRRSFWRLGGFGRRSKYAHLAKLSSDGRIPIRGATTAGAARPEVPSVCRAVHSSPDRFLSLTQSG